MSQLRFEDPAIRAELAEAFTNDYEPSEAAQAAFFDAYARCNQGEG